MIPSMRCFGPADPVSLRDIRQAGAAEVVTALHEGIKTHGPGRDALIDAYRQSLTNLAACGIEVVTCNSMSLLDWTRTDLAWALPDGARALRCEWEAVAVFDIHMLERPGAADDYDPALRSVMPAEAPVRGPAPVAAE